MPITRAKTLAEFQLKNKPTRLLSALRLLIAGLTCLGAVQAEAGRVQIQCEAKGQLSSFQIDGSGEPISFQTPKGLMPRKKTEDPSPVSFDELCANLDTCFGQFRELAKTAQDSLKVLERVQQLETSARAIKYRIKNDTPSNHLTSALEQLKGKLESCRGEMKYLQVEMNKVKSVKIDYPFAGINRNKRGAYSKEALLDVIEQAVNAGTDPYLALGIVVLENPPVINKYGDKGYGQNYGSIPVDAIAAVDQIGCIQPGWGSNGKYNYITRDDVNASSAIERKLKRANAALKQLEGKKSLEKYIDERGETKWSSSKYKKLLGYLDEDRKSLSTTEEQVERERRRIAEIEEQLVSRGVASNPKWPVPPLAVDGPLSVSVLDSGDFNKENDEALIQELAALRKSVASNERERERLEDSINRMQIEVDDLRRIVPALEARLARFRGQPSIAEYENALAEAERHRKMKWDFLDTLRKEKGEKAHSELSCIENRESCYAVLRDQASVPTADLSFLSSYDPIFSKATRLCEDSPKISRGESPWLRPGQKEGCCVDVVGSDIDDSLAMNVKGWIGAQFVRDQVQSCMKNRPLTYCIQKFNGLGCFNCTEKMDNDCYNGIVMDDRPVYGARVADLMVNSLMSNKEINALVEAASKRVGKPVVSSFCVQGGAGPRSLKTEQFLEEQKGYLLGGGEMLYKARVRADGGIRLRVPQSDDEIAQYRDNEQKRKIACEKHYN